MLKRKNRLDFNLCVTDAVLGASDHTCRKFIVEIVIMISYRNPTMHGNTAACIHIVK